MSWAMNNFELKLNSAKFQIWAKICAKYLTLAHFSSFSSSAAILAQQDWLEPLTQMRLYSEIFAGQSIVVAIILVFLIVVLLVGVLGR